MNSEGKHIKAFQSGTPYGFYSGRQGSVFDNYLMSYQNADMTGTYSSEGSDVSSVAKPTTTSNMATGEVKTATTTDGSNAIAQTSGGSGIWQNTQKSNNNTDPFIERNGNTIGAGLNIASGAIGKAVPTNNNINSGDLGISSAVSSMGPYGALFGGIANAGSSIGAAVAGDVDPETGMPKNEKAYVIGNTGAGVAKPLTTGVAAIKANKSDWLKDDEKYNNAGIVATSFVGMSGIQKAKLETKIAKRKKANFDEIEKKNKQYEKDLADRNKKIQTYNRALLGAGAIRISKNGGLLSYGYTVEYVPEINTIDRYIREPFKFKYTNKESIKDSTVKSFRRGSSIIPTGAYHHTSNNLGDLGLPVVDDNGVKIFEIETKELITGPEASIAMTDLVKEYNKTKDKAILKEISKVAKEELIKNTYSYNDEYSCLNEGNCKLKN